MNAKVVEREIHYDFTFDEVAFLESLDLWKELKKRLKSHEHVTIEGCIRIEQDE